MSETKLAILTLCCIMVVLIIHTIFIFGLIENNHIENGLKPPSDYFNFSKDIFIGEKTLGIWEVSEHYIIIAMNRTPIIGEIQGTGSMRPVFGKGHHSIGVKPINEKELYIGDIITYEIEDANETLVAHRIIDIDYDQKGWYAIARGDNNNINDGDKIRFNQIHDKVVAVIY